MARKIFFILTFLVPFSITAQKLTYKGFPSDIWPVLYDIKFKNGSGSSDDLPKPVFTSTLLGLQGKSVILPGYLVPFENGLSSKTFMLSSLPLNACFFCGVGGPETVVQVFCREPVRYTDKPVEIKGTLKLNDSNPEKMIYLLEAAELVGEIEF